MRENIPPCMSAPAMAQPEQPVVLSEFQVDGDQFLVVCLENNLDANSCSKESAYRVETSIEVDRFRVQGQLCAIVKVEQFSRSSEIDITTLLTERELQIATLVASGQANKQIAKQLRISEWTVSTHLRRIFIKLGVDSRAAMVYRCASIIQSLFGKPEPGITPLSERIPLGQP